MKTELKCTNCDNSFDSPEVLLSHQKATHDFLREMCETCGKMVKNYYQHKLVHNYDKLKVQCDLCKRKFFSKLDLKRHMLVHTGEKPLQCPKCEKRFVTDGNLYQHIMVHERAEEKAQNLPAEKNYVDDEYKCCFCKETFDDFESFKDHFFAEHVPKDESVGGFLFCFLF